MSITGDSTDGSVADRARSFYETLSHPIRESSLFYVTYWLSDVQQIDRVAFDFRQIRDRQFAAFQDFGIYTVVSELANAWSAFSVGMEPMNMEDQAMIDERADAFAAQLGADKEWTDDAKTDLAADIISKSEKVYAFTQQTPTRANVAKACNAAEVWWDAYSRSTRFLEVAKAVFEAVAFTVSVDEDDRTVEYDSGWASGYGGRPWAVIAEHLLRANGLPETAFVDQAWGLAHNNANWLDKIEAAPEEIDHVERLSDFPQMEADHWLYRGLLPAILDWAREGDIEQLYPIAASYTADLDVNLRRIAREVGIDLPRGEAGIISTDLSGEVQGVGEPQETPDAQRVFGRIDASEVDEVADPHAWEQEYAAALRGTTIDTVLHETLIVNPEDELEQVHIIAIKVEPTPPVNVTDDTSISIYFSSVDVVGPLTDLQPGDAAVYVAEGDQHGNTYTVIEQPDWMDTRADVYLETTHGAIAATYADVAIPGSRAAIRSEAEKRLDELENARRER